MCPVACKRCCNPVPDYCDTEGGSSGSPVLATATNKVIALHHCRGNSACSQSGSDPNRGVPITLINAQIGSLIGGSVTPTTPSPTPVPTPSPTVLCSANDRMFTLDLTTDRFGSETTWNVVNACSGATVLNNGPYSSGTETQRTEQYCLPVGERYTFTVFDSFGGKSESPCEDHWAHLYLYR